MFSSTHLIAAAVAVILFILVLYLLGFKISPKRRRPSAAELAVEHIDVVKAGQIEDKNTFIVKQSITINSLASILVEKSLTDEEIEYVQKSIDIASLTTKNSPLRSL